MGREDMSEYTTEAKQAMRFLCSMPSGNTTLDAPDLKSLMLKSGGQLLACGTLYNIKSDDLGAGVSRVSLEPFWAPEKRKQQAEPVVESQTDTELIDIVFDGPPGPVSGRFVETEDANGCGVGLGEWVERPDGCWVLRFPVATSQLRRQDSRPSIRL